VPTIYMALNYDAQNFREYLRHNTPLGFGSCLSGGVTRLLRYDHLHTQTILIFCYTSKLDVRYFDLIGTNHGYPLCISITVVQTEVNLQKATESHRIIYRVVELFICADMMSTDLVCADVNRGVKTN